MAADGRLFVQRAAEQERLDKFLVACLPEYSRARLQAFIKEGQVQINDRTVNKSSTLVEPGDRVWVNVPPVQPTALVAEDIPLHVVFENEDVLIVNKPAGMVVYPAAGHSSGTLVHAALAHAPELEGVGGEHRPGVVHRLDKDTSGLIVMAKNDRAHRWLQDQFRLRRAHKIYLALVDGKPPTPSGRIEAPIGRDPAHRKRMAITTPNKGREAVTEYFTREMFAQHTLLEARPLTGRTHQIRLHLALIGCPIVGDGVYGRHTFSLEIERHFLHAFQLSIVLPGEQQARTFEAALPPELIAVLEALRRQQAVF